MKKQKDDLSTLDWQIYNFIKERSVKGQWTKQTEIQEHLLNSCNVDMSTRNIRRCINRIRKSDKIQKIILTDYNKGYRFMSTDDEKTYLLNRRISILKMLKQYWKDVDRFEKNNQTKLTFDTQERNYIESLVKIEN